MELFLYFIKLLYLFLPAFVANGIPLIARKCPLIKNLNYPIHELFLGKNKTYRGLISGIIIAIIISILQYYFPIKNLIIINIPNVWYSILNGLMLGTGSLGGDIVKSYFKRKCNIKPGASFFPWDGIDYIVGSLICFSPIYLPSLSGIIFLLILGLILSRCCNILSYNLGIKEVPY